MRERVFMPSLQLVTPILERLGSAPDVLEHLRAKAACGRSRFLRKGLNVAPSESTEYGITQPSHIVPPGPARHEPDQPRSIEAYQLMRTSR